MSSFAQPGAAELADSVAHLVEFAGVVGVGVDDDLAAGFFRHAQVVIVQVQAVWVGVVFHRYSQASGGAEYLRHVQLISIAAEEHPSCRVAEDADVGIFEARRTRSVICASGWLKRE